jgi:hypothetical protein
MGAAEDDLQHCRREVFRLLNENAALRYAAKSFGDLAERLNLIVSRHQQLGLLRSAASRQGSNQTIPEHTMANTSQSGATPKPARTDDYSATQAPENQEHVQSTMASLDAKLHPGGAHSIPVDPGITNLHRAEVPGLDSSEEPHERSAAEGKRD